MKPAIATVLLTLALLALALAPPSAVAANAPRTDPEAGSPSEAIYGIPLEEARREAAPNPSEGSAIRSENGVGSSARVPGLEAARRAGHAGLKGGRERADRGRSAPSPTASAGEPAPTDLGTSALLVLTILLAVGAGLVAGRRRGGR